MMAVAWSAGRGEGHGNGGSGVGGWGERGGGGAAETSGGFNLGLIKIHLIKSET